MKIISKKNIDKWCISWQIQKRPSKVAKGILYTNERRARKTNNSFLYAGFVDKSKYKITNECRSLGVYGTLDSLTCNKLKKFKIKQSHKAYILKNKK